MNEDKLRKICAEKAMEYIKNNTVIGLGAGRNIACIVELLSRSVQNGFKVKVITPSEGTKKLCIKNGIEVLPTCFVSQADTAFDGCNEVDENFYANKSGGGVFTREKLIASMAKDYILLVDDKKYVNELSCRYPVTLEVIKDALEYVSSRVKNLGGKVEVRTSVNKDGFLVTDDGNYLMDVKFEHMQDIKKLNDDLNRIHGIVGTSLFTEEVTKVIVSGENGVRVISRS